MALYVKKDGQLIPLSMAGGDVKLQSFLIVNDTDDVVDIELLNGYDITYKLPIREVEVRIPRDIDHGYYAGLNFKASEEFIVNIVNNSNFDVKIIKLNILEPNIKCHLDKVYNIALYCDGIDIRVYYYEL